MTKLADVLQPLAGVIPSSLVSPASLAAVAESVCELPSELTQHFGFECALGDAAATADFALAIVPQEGQPGPERLLGLGQIPTAYLAHPVWDRLRQFSSLWAAPDSPLHANVRNLCLEFDLRDAGPIEIPVPSAFFAPRHGLTREDAAGNVLTSTWVLAPAIRLLRGSELPSAAAGAVARCVAALPVGAHIFQVGLMLARPVDAVRLCIRGLELSEMPGYLAHVGWPGDWAEARTALAPFAGLATQTALHLDVGNAVYPRIGLECYLEAPEGSNWSPGALAFLDALADAGLCVPSKYTGLLAWPGEQRIPADRVTLPPAVVARARLLGRAAFTIYRREINHIKLSFTAGGRLEAKAYVGVVLHWRLGRTGTAPPLTVNQADW